MFMCKQEGIDTSKETITNLVEVTNGDIRQVCFVILIDYIYSV